MRAIYFLVAVGLGAAPLGFAAAAEQHSGDSMPGVNSRGQVQLVPGSMIKRGPQARFDVVVESGAHQGRRIRYVADCEKRSLAAAEIALAR